MTPRILYLRRMKTCSSCKISKEISGFSKQKSKDGLRPQCKGCIRTYNQVHWASKIVCSSRGHDIRAARSVLGVDYIDGTWVTELVRESPNCHYCDVPLRYGRGVDRCTNPDGLQLDRMDNTLPHAKSNCVQCCRTCNNRCQNIPYTWKVLSHGGDFTQFGKAWCPGKYHVGDDHVRDIDDFGADARNPDGLNSYCRACRESDRANRLRNTPVERQQSSSTVFSEDT